MTMNGGERAEITPTSHRTGWDHDTLTPLLDGSHSGSAHHSDISVIALDKETTLKLKMADSYTQLCEWSVNRNMWCNLWIKQYIQMLCV